MTRFFHGTLAVLVLTTVAISAWGMWAGDIQVQFEQLLPKFALYAVVLAGAVFYGYRGEQRFVTALLMVFWMGVVSDLHVFPMFVAGRQPADFHDAWLAQMDRALGLEVPTILAWLADYPGLNAFLDWIYATLVYLMTCAILIPAFANRLRTAQEYVLSCVASVMICFPFFAVFHAYGPWVAYNFEPNPNQTEFMHVFQMLLSQDTFVMDLGYVHGLLCFPSFHTILAVLAGIALWSVPYLRWPAALWSALIVVSTVTTGWHYVVDVAAGLVVVLVSVAAAKAYTWLERRWTSSTERPIQLVLEPCLQN